MLLWGEIEEYLEEFDDEYLEESDNIKPIASRAIEENLNENSQAISTIGNTDTKGEIGKNIKVKEIQQ